MTASTYMIWNSQKIYLALNKYLGIFERKKKDNNKLPENEKLSGHAVLFGHNRVGSKIRPALEKLAENVVVVDFNPEIVDKLQKSGINVLYGDMSDHELYEDLALDKAGLVISTVPDLKDNLNLLKGLKELRKRNNHYGHQVVMLTASDQFDATRLYDEGADYVLEPFSVSGDFLSHVLEQHSKGEGRDNKMDNLYEYFVSGKRGGGGS